MTYFYGHFSSSGFLAREPGPDAEVGTAGTAAGPVDLDQLRKVFGKLCDSGDAVRSKLLQATLDLVSYDLQVLFFLFCFFGGDQFIPEPKRL